MRSIEKEQILRINCPGYGTESHFTLGTAAPLKEYRVIVVNPTSIVHLFDKDPHLLHEIDQAQQQGMTSYTTKSDSLLQSIAPDLKQRHDELIEFLELGGLLVYFLCPPFRVEGPHEVMDNYNWLDDLAPDKPHEQNKRHMSSVGSGKHFELADNAEYSAFVRYLKQPSMEWHTLVREENLSEGYEILATAGNHKCVSARKKLGNSGGQIVFLPSPYKNDFDRQLTECIKLWHGSQPSIILQGNQEKATHATNVDETKNSADENKMPAAELDLQPPAIDAADQAPDAPPDNFIQASAADEHNADKAPEQPEPVLAESTSLAEPNFAPDANEISALENPPAASNDEASPYLAQADNQATPYQFAPEEPEHEPQEPEWSQALAQPYNYNESPAYSEPPPAVLSLSSEASSESKPANDEPREDSPRLARAKEFMKKMVNIGKSAAPEWCLQYSFSDLDSLRRDLAELNVQLETTQLKIQQTEAQISELEDLKNALLWAEDEHLRKACTTVFEKLGFACKQNGEEAKEMSLSQDEQTTGLAHIIRSSSGATRPQLAQLAESVITYWGEHGSEPKGILVTSTWADLPPVDRKDKDYSDDLNQFAEKKHLCLVTSAQLLCIYRDLTMEKIQPEEMRNRLLETNGRLSGFSLEKLEYAEVP